MRDIQEIAKKIIANRVQKQGVLQNTAKTLVGANLETQLVEGYEQVVEGVGNMVYDAINVLSEMMSLVDFGKNTPEGSAEWKKSLTEFQDIKASLHYFKEGLKDRREEASKRN